MAVTAKDVARETGLSLSTVSRALSEPDRVAEGTRELVVAAAQRLGYRPNRAAAGLRAGRTGALGLVVPDLENPYFASITKGVQARARATGRAAFVVDSGEDPELEAELARDLRDQTDGVVLCSPRAVEADLEVLAGRPVVLVNRSVDGVASLIADETAGTARAVEHLRALGHTRIAYVGGPERSWSDARRREGLRAAAAALGNVELIEIGSFRPHVEGGRSAADLVAASGATAAIAYNDLVAVGLVDRLRARGLEVPRDMSVLGFDDTYVATLLSPGLTSVRTDLAELGARAVDLLVAQTDRRAEPVAPSVRTMPVELLVRASTALPPTVSISPQENR